MLEILQSSHSESPILTLEINILLSLYSCHFLFDYYIEPPIYTGYIKRNDAPTLFYLDKQKTQLQPVLLLQTNIHTFDYKPFLCNIRLLTFEEAKYGFCKRLLFQQALVIKFLTMRNFVR